MYESDFDKRYKSLLSGSTSTPEVTSAPTGSFDERFKKLTTPSQAAANEQAGKPNFFHQALESINQAVTSAFSKLAPQEVVLPMQNNKKPLQGTTQPLTETGKPDNQQSTASIQPVSTNYGIKPNSIFDTLSTAALSVIPFGGLLDTKRQQREITGIQDYLSKNYNGVVTQTLAHVQQKIEEDFKNRPETYEFTKKITQLAVGGTQAYADYFNNPVSAPKDLLGKARATAGEVAAGVMTMYAGGKALESLGFARATLPVLFASLGQLTASEKTTITQRLEKLPKDLLTGWLFGKVPQSDKLLSVDTLKGAIPAGFLNYTSEVIDKLIMGMNPTDAAKTSWTAGIVGALFHTAGVAQSQLTSAQFKQNEVTMTPEQIRAQVDGTNITETAWGKDLLKVAQQAEAQGKSAKIEVVTSKESPAANIIGKGAVEQLTGKPQEIKFQTGNGADMVMRVELVDTQQIQLLSEEGAPTPLSPTGESGIVPVASNALQEGTGKGATSGVGESAGINSTNQSTAHVVGRSENVDAGLREVLSATASPQEATTALDAFVSNYSQSADTKQLADLRAGLVKEITTLTGGTGDYKKDYAIRVALRNDTEIGGLLTSLENHIQTIDNTIRSSVRAPGGIASSGSEAIGKFEKLVSTTAQTKDFKLFEKSKELVRTYASRIGEKYLRVGAGGLYHPESKNIRTNGMNDLSTNIHEISHAIDDRYKISKSLYKKTGETITGKPLYDRETSGIRRVMTELYTKYYAGGKKGHAVSKRMTEGFATLVQKYVEMPSTITEEFPELVDQFLKPGGKFFTPTIGEMLADAKKIVAEYQGLSDLDKVGARVVNQTMNTDKSFLSVPEKIRTFMEDEIYPVEKLGKIAGTDWSGGDPSLWLRQYARGGGLYANNVLNEKGGYWTIGTDGNAKKTLDFNWKNLVDLLTAAKTTDSFGYYLVSRDQTFEWKELDKLKEDYDTSLAMVESVGQEQAQVPSKDGVSLWEEMNEKKQAYQDQKKYLERNGFLREEVEGAYLGNKHRFIEEEKMYDALVRQDLKLLHQPNIGIVNDESYNRYTSKEGYASMKRVFFDDILGDAKSQYVGPGGKLAPKISSLKKRSGGQQMIINPVLNGLINHIEITKKSMKQIIYNSLAPIAEKGAAPELLQKVALRSFKDDTGKMTFPQEKDENVVMARVGYKRTPILVDKLIKETIDNVLTVQSMNIFEHLLVTAGRTFTIGTTGAYAPFALVNFPADQWNAVLNTRNNYTPVLDQIKIFSQLMSGKGGEVAQHWAEWQVMGGDKMTLFQSQMQSTEEAVKYITHETKALEKVIGLIDKGVEIGAMPSKYSETITRFSEYHLARKAGKHQIVAFEEAGRFTAPFHHIGSWKFGDKASGKFLIRSVPFANASLQVVGQAIRTAETPEGKKRLVWIMLAAAAAYLSSVGAIALYGTKDQKEQYKDLRPTDIAMYLHFPSFIGKGLDRVRVSQEMSTIGTIISMILAQQVLGVKYSFDDYKQALTEWIPRHLNIFSPVEMFFAWTSVIKTPFELIGNFKDYPKISPLENRSMLAREPKDRYNEGTSWVARKLGETFNLSPIKMDYLLSQTFGRAIGFITLRPKIYNPTSAVHRDYLFTLGRRIENFYEDSTTVDQQVKSLKDKYDGKVMPSSERARYTQLKMKQARYNQFDKLLKQYREVDQKDTEQLRNKREQLIPILERLLK